MPQEAFTPTGVQNKINALYAMDDAALQSETALLRSDFRAWMNNNFVLDAQQQAYLAAMDQEWIDKTSEDINLAMKKRLPITLVKEGTGDVASKVIRKDFWYIDDDGSGALIFTISYS